jgi:hypothetical protein
MVNVNTTSAAWAAMLLTALGASGSAFAQASDAFRTRNLNPLVSIFGLPSWDSGKAAQSFGITSELANHYRLSERGSDRLILDGETWRNNLFFNHSLSEDWFIGAELPYYQQSGGVLDDVVDAWHSAFRLPDGGRNNRGEDELLMQLGDSAGTFFNLDERQRGWGDLQLSVAHRLGVERGFVVEATVKLSTGEERMLAGSGATDWAISLFRSVDGMAFKRSAGYFWGMGLMRNGDPDLIDYDNESFTYFGVVGGGLKVLPSLGIKAQIDLHTPFYDTPLEELGQAAVQATIGGWWEMSRRGVLEFAISEDLHVSTAPDVVLYIGLIWKR